MISNPKPNPSLTLSMELMLSISLPRTDPKPHSDPDPMLSTGGEGTTGRRSRRGAPRQPAGQVASARVPWFLLFLHKVSTALTMTSVYVLVAAPQSPNDIMPPPAVCSRAPAMATRFAVRRWSHAVTLLHSTHRTLSLAWLSACSWQPTRRSGRASWGSSRPSPPASRCVGHDAVRTWVMSRATMMTIITLSTTRAMFTSKAR